MFKSQEQRCIFVLEQSDLMVKISIADRFLEMVVKWMINQYFTKHIVDF